jgi:hypothetical protein
MSFAHSLPLLLADVQNTDEREVRIAAKRSSKLTRAAIAGCSVVAALTLACIALLQGKGATVNSSVPLQSYNDQSHLQQQQRSVVALDDYNADRSSSSRAAQNAVADELRQLAATGDYRVRVSCINEKHSKRICYTYNSSDIAYLYRFAAHGHVVVMSVHALPY